MRQEQIDKGDGDGREVLKNQADHQTAIARLPTQNPDMNIPLEKHSGEMCKFTDLPNLCLCGSRNR